MYLKEIHLLHDKMTGRNDYPFNIAAIKESGSVNTDHHITFFVGENGSGKSTLLEAIAWQCEFNTASGGSNTVYETEHAESALGPYIRLSWMPRVRNGFFLRAESFYQFASYLDREVREQPGFAAQFYAPYGGKSLHHQSHGEAFLSLFNNRFGAKALYLLDEPEAALSPARQLSLLSLIHRMRHNAQFIIATHSPILLGYPDALIYSFDESPLGLLRYEETLHYQITRRFLEQRNNVLKELFEDN